MHLWKICHQESNSHNSFLELEIMRTRDQMAEKQKTSSQSFNTQTNSSCKAKNLKKFITTSMFLMPTHPKLAKTTLVVDKSTLHNAFSHPKFLLAWSPCKRREMGGSKFNLKKKFTNTCVKEFVCRWQILTSIISGLAK